MQLISVFSISYFKNGYCFWIVIGVEELFSQSLDDSEVENVFYLIGESIFFRHASQYPSNFWRNSNTLYIDGYKETYIT